MAAVTAIGKVKRRRVIKVDLRYKRNLHEHESPQRGIVLLAALIFMFITTLGAVAMVDLQRTQSQRAREAELLFVGDQFRYAIKSYYSTIPPGAKQTLPRTLDDLLQDPRFSMPVRHLRRIYVDPMTGKADWILVQEAGGIVGIHSRSSASTLKKKDFPLQYGDFQDKATYGDWVFFISLN